MKLKFCVDSKDAIPESLAEHYTEKDGKFYLQVDGAVERTKLDEFRDQNIELRKKVESLEKKAISPEERKEYAELKELKGKLDEKTLVEAGKVDEAVEARTKAMKESTDKRIAELEKSLSERTAAIATLKIDNTLTALAGKQGARTEALPDIISRGREIFSIDPETGDVTARDREGRERFGVDGKPLKVDEWINELPKSAPHLFTPSTGGGSASQSGSSTSTGNPWKPDSLNITEQGRIYKADPAKARRLAAEAGKKLPEAP
jgi:dephospho-CoA kinase